MVSANWPRGFCRLTTWFIANWPCVQATLCHICFLQQHSISEIFIFFWYVKSTRWLWQTFACILILILFFEENTRKILLCHILIKVNYSQNSYLWGFFFWYYLNYFNYFKCMFTHLTKLLSFSHSLLRRKQGTCTHSYCCHHK